MYSLRPAQQFNIIDIDTEKIRKLTPNSSILRVIDSTQPTPNTMQQQVNQRRSRTLTNAEQECGVTWLK